MSADPQSPAPTSPRPPAVPTIQIAGGGAGGHEHRPQRAVPEVHRHQLVAVVPLLGDEVRSEVVVVVGDRVIHEGVVRRGDQAPTGPEDAVQLAQCRLPVLEVVQDKGGQHDVEGTVGERQRFSEISMVESDVRPQPLPGDLQQAGSCRTR